MLRHFVMAGHSASKTRVNALRRGEASRGFTALCVNARWPAPTPADMLVTRRPFDGDVRDVLDVPAAPRFDRRGDRRARDAPVCRGAAPGRGSGTGLAHRPTLDCCAHDGRSALSAHRDPD